MKKVEYVLWVLILIMLLFKFFYIGIGAYAITDEWRYDLVFGLIEAIKQGDYDKFCKALIDTNGRPAELLVRFPFAIIQVIWYKLTGLPVNRSNFIPQFQNYLVVLLNTFLFYKICLYYSKEQSCQRLISLVCTIVYCGLLNHGFYIRHLLPYDNSLCFFLAAIYFTLPIRSFINYWFVGFLLGLGFTIYPGYFLFVGIISTAIFVKSIFDSNLQNFFKLAVGIFSVLAFWEIVTRIGGYSYISSLKNLSGTITQGSFDEGLVYPFLYLWQVEYFTGWVLILMMFIPIFLNLKKNHSSSYILIISTIAFLFLIMYALQCYFLRKMVFYGRILHMFMPLFAISFCITINYIIEKVRIIFFLRIILVFVLIVFVDFLIKNNAFINIAYPRDVLLTYGIDKWVDTSIEKENYNNNLAFEIENVAYRPKSTLTASQQKFFFVNFAYFHPIVIDSYRSLQYKELIFEKPHFQSYYVYSYEGLSFKEREYLQSINPKLRIFLLVK
ncbi:MAG: hypothetical protein RMJ87_04855 [Cytophagales bacterium]|nr:hypothetical protein [Bernardetiaceae bacterium]MDW8204341.1 hypothetical protein [Cytophagales bacterium]